MEKGEREKEAAEPAPVMVHIFSKYLQDTEGIMTAREAIRILMLSPIYFQIPPSDRIQLIKDYCILFVSDPKKKK